MTRTYHDLFAKQHLETLLEPVGTVTTSRKVISETREIDVWFVPKPDAQLALNQLGILGRMVRQSCAIEPFHNAVQSHEIDSCIGKRVNVTEELIRQAKRETQSLSEQDLPRLWILSPTVSKRTLQGFSAIGLTNWPKGFYFLPTELRTAVVALHQLPIAEETLWLRLMARGKVQRQAISELLALPANHPMRQNTIEQLAVLRINLNVLQNLNEEERALAMNLSPVYEKWRQETLQEGRQEGELKGRQEGRQEGERSLVLRLLSRRIGNLSPNVVSKVEALSLPQLEMLGEALLDFMGAEDLMTWLEANQ
ncbi:DUF4351 domain-containing protein [Altericista sp. CCNU0014]|uniref:DUF4351 domain-containing protein n=1 Tax=Altericista sp. CCNU0014 TaxID=3082949 RepID=UPI00384B7CDB